MLFAALAYFLLQSAIIRDEGPQSALAVAVGKDWKGKTSPALCALGIALSPVDRWVSLALYVLVALLWFVPDRRVESRLGPSLRGTG